MAQDLIITVVTDEDGKSVNNVTCSMNCCFAVPGVVTNLTGRPKFTSIVLKEILSGYLIS